MKLMHTTKGHKNPEEPLDPQPLDTWLTSQPLAYLVLKAKQLQTTQAALLTLLPTELAPHCWVMNISQEILVLGVNSPHWATRLRYLAPHLLPDLKRILPHLAPVTKIHAKVRPS